MQRLDNRAARRLFLHRHALSDPPAGEDLLALVRRLGFVQVDSINTVERAHHMILWSRRPGYRPAALARALERDRSLFEHWTHDASVIPAEFFPHWRLRFARDAARLRGRFRDWQGPDFEGRLDAVLDHVRAAGPVAAGELAGKEPRGSGGWWDWHPSKTALEYLWRSGALSVAARRNFAKLYDLTERVLPGPAALPAPEPEATIDWLCAAALDRLGFATPGEIAAFWATATPAEARGWCARKAAAGEIEPVEVLGADGSPRRAFARPGIVEAARTAPEPPGRVRILSPFDPALRDRARAERLFGFHYRIEVFVPGPRRRFGYYVFPVLEGDRLIGRLDARAARQEGMLRVAAFWPERGVAMGAGRRARLEAALVRLARFAGCGGAVDLAPGWLREPA